MRASIRKWIPRRAILVVWAVAIAATAELWAHTKSDPFTCFLDRAQDFSLSLSYGEVELRSEFPAPRKRMKTQLFSFAGFGYWAIDMRDHICRRDPVVWRFIRTPLWFPLLAFLGASLLIVRKVERFQMRPRQRPGLCPKCGYDSRGNSTNVCPECGTIIQALQPSVAQTAGRDATRRSL